MFDGLLKYFPSNYTPNKQQVSLLREIDQSFNDGYKFVICTAPTGTGKSFISKTLAAASAEPDQEFAELVNSFSIYKRTQYGGYAYEEDVSGQNFHGAFALTITKSLQDQYQSLFPDINVLKGKNNYQCQINTNNTVEFGPCIFSKTQKESCWTKNLCPYYTNRNKILLSRFSTLNYNMFFSLPKFLRTREYLICDEASELEDQIVKEFTLKINLEFIKKILPKVGAIPRGDYGKTYKWLNGVMLSVAEKVDEAKEEIEHINNDFIKNQKITDLIKLRNLHSRMKSVLDTWHDSEYIMESSKSDITFIPLKVNKLSKCLFDCGKKIVLLSATIIDVQNFCKNLGIQNYKHVEADTTFDSAKAPIYITTGKKLNYNNLRQHLPNIAKQIKDIALTHKHEKGVIHTHTNNITEYLKELLRDNNRYLFREPGISNEYILQKHSEADEPTILVSPSITHGIDLRDELARFQIIVKAPYLSLQDVRVKEMMRIDYDWYSNKMLSQLIQACGRGIRSKDDYCTTYILDGAVSEQVIKNRHKLPKYFLERFV